MKKTLTVSLLVNGVLVLVCTGLLWQRGEDEDRSLDVRMSSIPVKQLAVLANPGIDVESVASDDPDPIEAFAVKAPFVTRRVERAYPVPPPAEVTVLLEARKAQERTDHLGFLLEYGLRVHLGYLVHTRLSQELPLDTNPMLAELVRLTGIAPYANAHEAGWLNDQFHGEFTRTGYSSYQIYLWAKEHRGDILTDGERFSNGERIDQVLQAIDKSSLQGVGGGNVCHYDCL
jgi:hypothetical protein